MSSSPDYKQIVIQLRDFVNTPTPVNSNDYKRVSEEFVKAHEITTIFATLIAEPASFPIISAGILKLFRSPLGPQLIRDENVTQWIISGLQQSTDAHFEQLNILAIEVLHAAIQTDDDVAFWITHDKSTLFLWCLSLISSPFETSFQKFEKIILKHSSNQLLLQTLFSKNIIDLLFNVKAANNDTDNVMSLAQMDTSTVHFRGHVLWIGALHSYYTKRAASQPPQSNENDKGDGDGDGDADVKGNDDDDDEADDDAIIRLYTEHGLFDDLLQLLQSDDVLIQINVLPLLSSLAEFDAGLRLLLQRHIVKILRALLSSEDAGLFGKEVYKVLIAMITAAKKSYADNEAMIEWLHDPQLMQIIKLGFENFNDDISVQESCCVFLGVFASFFKILKMFVLLTQNENRTPLSKLHSFVNGLEANPSVENKALAIAALHGLSEVFTLRSSDKEVCQFQMSLIQGIDGGMSKLLELCKSSPDDEMRFAAFRALNNICKQDWGMPMVNECAGLFEYMTDRREPDIMAVCKWKYAVCESMFKNRNMRNVLDATHQEQLKKYIADGVVFNHVNESKNKKRGDNVVQLGWEQR